MNYPLSIIIQQNSPLKYIDHGNEGRIYLTPQNTIIKIIPKVYNMDYKALFFNECMKGNERLVEVYNYELCGKDLILHREYVNTVDVSAYRLIWKIRDLLLFYYNEWYSRTKQDRFMWFCEQMGDIQVDYKILQGILYHFDMFGIKYCSDICRDNVGWNKHGNLVVYDT